MPFHYFQLNFEIDGICRHCIWFLVEEHSYTGKRPFSARNAHLIFCKELAPQTLGNTKTPSWNRQMHISDSHLRQNITRGYFRFARGANLEGREPRYNIVFARKL